MNLQEMLQNAQEPVEILGFGAQAVFFSRFLIQWIASEKRKESVIPIGFWWCSVFGGVLMLIYAVLLMRPALILGQGLGAVVYVRNLMFIYRKRAADAAAQGGGAATEEVLPGVEDPGP